MANNLMLNVEETLNVKNLVDELADAYRGKGFTVNTVAMKNGSHVLTFDKGVGGINMLLGMGIGQKATISVKNGVMTVMYSEAEWTGKIVGFVVGLFLCGIPFITAAIGSIKQMNFPKELSNDITMLVD